MCGGFVAIYSRSSTGRFIPHILYNLGRLLTYLILGAVAALLGSSIDAASGIARISSLLVALWLIIFGAISLFRSGQAFFEGLQASLNRRFGRFIKPILTHETRLKPFLVGFLTTFLPCGWLYAFVALALGAADLRVGLAVMFVFWLGTVPAMLGIGLASGFIAKALGARMPRVTAFLLMMSGLLCLNFHLSHVHHHQHHHHAACMGEEPSNPPGQ